MSIPRLSEHYLVSAEYFFSLGQEEQAWFNLMAAWFYEDEDEQLAKGTDHEWTKETPGWRFPGERAQLDLDIDIEQDDRADPYEVQAQAA